MRTVHLAGVSLVTLVSFLVCPASISAQSFQGGLRGAVRDAQGVIPGATVVLLNEASGVSRDTLSNGSGEFNGTSMARKPASNSAPATPAILLGVTPRRMATRGSSASN